MKCDEFLKLCFRPYTLREACEILAFGQLTKAMSDPDGKKREIETMLMYEPLRNTHVFDRYLLKPDDMRYKKAMAKVSHALYNVLKRGEVTAFYDHHSQKQAVSAEVWGQDLNPNDILSDKQPYCDMLIDTKQLRNVFPIKQYTVTLNDDGDLYVDDGNKTTLIYKTNPKHKTYQWLKVYFDHPNQHISKQDAIKYFDKTYYTYSKQTDKISQCIFATFGNNSPLMHCCFPVLGEKGIYCTPTFTSTDALVLCPPPFLIAQTNSGF